MAENNTIGGNAISDSSLENTYTKVDPASENPFAEGGAYEGSTPVFDTAATQYDGIARPAEEPLYPTLGDPAEDNGEPTGDEPQLREPTQAELTDDTQTEAYIDEELDATQTAVGMDGNSAYESVQGLNGSTFEYYRTETGDEGAASTVTNYANAEAVDDNEDGTPEDIRVTAGALSYESRDFVSYTPGENGEDGQVDALGSTYAVPSDPAGVVVLNDTNEDGTPDSMTVLGETYPGEEPLVDEGSIPGVEFVDGDDSDETPDTLIVNGTTITSTNEIPVPTIPDTGAVTVPEMGDFTDAVDYAVESYVNPDLSAAVEGGDVEGLSDITVAETEDVVSIAYEAPELANPADTVDPATEFVNGYVYDDEGNVRSDLIDTENLTGTAQYFGLANDMILGLDPANAINVYGYDNIAAIVNSIQYPSSNLILQETFVRLTPLTVAINMALAGGIASYANLTVTLIEQSAALYLAGLDVVSNTVVAVQGFSGGGEGGDPADPQDPVNRPFDPVFDSAEAGLGPVFAIMTALGMDAVINSVLLSTIEQGTFVVNTASLVVLLPVLVVVLAAEALNPEVAGPAVAETVGMSSTLLEGTSEFLLALAGVVDGIQPDYGTLPKYDTASTVADIQAAEATLIESTQIFLNASLGYDYMTAIEPILNATTEIIVGTNDVTYEIYLALLNADFGGSGGGGGDPEYIAANTSERTQLFIDTVMASGGDTDEVSAAIDTFSVGLLETATLVALVPVAVALLLVEAGPVYAAEYRAIIEGAVADEQANLAPAVDNFVKETILLTESLVRFSIENYAAIERLFGYEEPLLVYGTPEPGSEDKYDEAFAGGTDYALTPLFINNNPYQADGILPDAETVIEMIGGFLPENPVDLDFLGPLAPSNLDDTLMIYYAPLRDLMIAAYPDSAEYFARFEPMPTDVSDVDQLVAYSAQVAGITEDIPTQEELVAQGEALVDDGVDYDTASFDPTDVDTYPTDVAGWQALAGFLSSEEGRAAMQDALLGPSEPSTFTPEGFDASNPDTYPSDQDEGQALVDFWMEPEGYTALTGYGSDNFTKEGFDYNDPATYPREQSEYEELIAYWQEPEGQAALQEMFLGAPSGDPYEPSSFDPANVGSYPSEPNGLMALLEFLLLPEGLTLLTGIGSDSFDETAFNYADPTTYPREQSEYEALVAYWQEPEGQAALQEMFLGTPSGDAYQPENFDAANPSTYPSDQDEGQALVDFWMEPEGYTALTGYGSDNFTKEGFDYNDPATYPREQSEYEELVGYWMTPEGQAALTGQSSEPSTYDPQAFDAQNPDTYPADQNDAQVLFDFWMEPEGYTALTGYGSDNFTKEGFDYNDPATYPREQSEYEELIAYWQEPEGQAALMSALVPDDGVDYDPSTFDPQNPDTYPSDSQGVDAFTNYYSDSDNLMVLLGLAGFGPEESLSLAYSTASNGEADGMGRGEEATADGDTSLYEFYSWVGYQVYGTPGTPTDGSDGGAYGTWLDIYEAPETESENIQTQIEDAENSDPMELMPTVNPEDLGLENETNTNWISYTAGQTWESTSAGFISASLVYPVFFAFWDTENPDDALAPTREVFSQYFTQEAPARIPSEVAAFMTLPEKPPGGDDPEYDPFLHGKEEATGQSLIGSDGNILEANPFGEDAWLYANLMSETYDPLVGDGQTTLADSYGETVLGLQL